MPSRTDAILLIVLALFVGPARAQGAVSSAEARAAEHRVAMSSWDRNRGRALFEACDEDRDDALDLLETFAALEWRIDPSAPERFRRLDRNRDGFLDWAEFDAFASAVIAEGRTFRLALSRDLPPSAEVSLAPASLAENLLQLFDSDADGSMSNKEFAALLRRAGLPESLASRFSMLDTDRSGVLGVAEIDPLLKLGIPQIANLTAKRGGVALLPQPYAAWDLDGSGILDRTEVAVAVKRADPELARFAPQIFAGLDKDHDGRLSLSELAPKAPLRVARPR
ncbi:MAG: hypothetical protein Fur0037_21010 [Planctomycetota bacterium]